MLPISLQTIPTSCRTNPIRSEYRKLRLLATLILGTLPGFAAPTTYTLSATYAGGITATGTFTFDATTDSVSNVDVTLSGPSRGFYNFFAEGPVVFDTVQTNSVVNPVTGRLNATFLPTGSDRSAIHARAQLTFQGVSVDAAGAAAVSPAQSSLSILGEPNFVEPSVTGAIAALGREKHAAAGALAAHPALSLTNAPDATNPSPVTTFTPGQGASGVSLSPTLTWGASANTTSYAVYFGTSTNPPFVGNTANTSFNVGPLNPNTLYYWYLISQNSTSSTQSFLWYFTTTNASQATNPSPVTTFTPGQGAAGVSLSPTLTWGASANTTSYAVYFGTSTNPPFVGNTANTSFNVGPLNPNTLYYWYLISQNSTGSTQSFLWYFTTGASADPAFFAGEVSVGSGAYYLQFPDSQLFGYYTYVGSPILYHYDMGFEAYVAGSASDIYFYDFTSGHWWYSSSSLFPYLYDFTLNTWLYYFPDTHNTGHYTTNPRDFANLTTGAILRCDIKTDPVHRSRRTVSRAAGSPCSRAASTRRLKRSRPIVATASTVPFWRYMAHASCFSRSPLISQLSQDGA